MSRRAWLLNWFVGKASKKPAIQEMMTEMNREQRGARKSAFSVVYVQDLDVLRENDECYTQRHRCCIP